jgi:hypothetical protein
MNRRGFVKCGFGAIATGSLTGIFRGANTTLPKKLAIPGQAAVNPFIGKQLYDNDLLKWLYIGWENDHPKSWTFMGGAVAPGLGPAIQYALTVNGITCFPDEFAPDRKSKIKWYLRDGYLPCPVSRWIAGPVQVEIQHFSNRILKDSVTALYSRVRITNSSKIIQSVRLNINAGPNAEVPLSHEPTGAHSDSMYYDMILSPGQSLNRDFVAFATGSRVQPAQLKSQGSFDLNYDAMSKYWHTRIEPLTSPVTLPVSGMVKMYKSIQIMIRENMVKNGNDYEIHPSPTNPSNNHSYDHPFSHDAPNYIDQYMREGDFELAKKMLASSYFKASDTTTWKGLDAGDPAYQDAVGKHMLPYAEYLRCTGDTSYFTPDIQAELKKTSRDLRKLRVFDDPEHYGLMEKSQDFENFAGGGDYLLCDNWSALHGLQAYKYICVKLGNNAEAQWASDEMKDLNDCLNKALEKTCTRRKTEYYVGAFDDITLEQYRSSAYSWVPYSGALSTFPWGASLRGFELGGFWKDRFDDSIQYALEQRDARQIPDGSWGTWWGQPTYGTAYNCSAGLQCLFSDKYRTEVAKNLEFQLENQCVPYNWPEAFEYKGKGQWVGMYEPPVSFGNLDSWGASFTNQALLQVCASVKNDGTVILGRGIPDQWLSPGSVIEWSNVNVNENRKINFKITAGQSEVHLQIWGDVRNGNVHLNLPVFKDNIASADTGTIDNEKGTVILSPTTNSLSVKLRRPPQTRPLLQDRVKGRDGTMEILYPSSS